MKKSMQAAILLPVLIAALSSCATARHVMVPADPTFAAKRVDLSEATLYLTGFSISNQTSRDAKDGDKTDSMANEFLLYVSSTNRFFRVVDARHEPQVIDRNSPRITIDVRIAPTHTEYRTILLDALFYYPFCGYFPLTPQWGKATVGISYTISDDQGDVASGTAKDSKGYVIWFYPYYNKTIIDETFRTVYGNAFEKACTLIADSKPELQASVARQNATLNADQGIAALGKDGKAGSAAVATAAAARVKPVSPPVTTDVDIVKPGASPYAKNSIAVVIGNKDYRKGTVSVEFALRDAAKMKELFTKGFGIDANDVWLYENAGLADLISVFGTADNVRKSRVYRSAALRSDPPSLIVYYSGHGAPSTSGETKGKGYLLPVDTDLMSVVNTGYAIDDLVANISEMKKTGIIKDAMLIFDACFSGQVGDGSQIIQNVSGISIRPVMPAMAGNGTTLLFASSGDEFASWYPDKGYGLFTYFLLKGLEGAADSDNNARISMPELDSYLKRMVPRFANGLNGQEQTPQCFYGDLKDIVSY
jgi:hypothetical protein